MRGTSRHPARSRAVRSRALRSRAVRSRAVRSRVVRRRAPWIALTAMALALAGCGEAGVEGRWSGQDEAGNRMTFDFRDGGEATWIVEVGEAAPETIAMRYETDPSATPHAIDLSGFGSGPLQGVTMAGIYEFADDGTMRVDFEPVRDASGADSVRPKAFTGDAVEFRRVEGG